MKEIEKKKLSPKRKWGIIAATTAFLVLAFLLLVPVRLNTAVTAEQLYQYEDLTMDQLSVEAETVFGLDYTVKKYELSGTDLNDTKNTVHFKKLYLQTDLEVEAVALQTIDTNYIESKAYAGRDLDLANVTVTFVYADGHEVDHSEFTVEGDPSYITGNAYTVLPQIDDFVLDADLSVPYIAITNVEPVAKYDWFNDDPVAPDSYVLTFEDGTSDTIASGDASVTSADKTIQDGDNTFTIDYHDLPYEIALVGREKLLTGAKAVEKEQFYIDEPIPYDQFAIEFSFEDYTVVELGNDDARVTIENEERLLDFGDNTFSAYYKDQPFEFTVNAIERVIKTVEPIVAEAYIDDTVVLSGLHILYEDGTEADKTDFTVYPNQILDRGENEVTVSYHNIDYDLPITAESYRPIVSSAIDVSSDLLEGDVLSFAMVTVTYDNETTEQVPSDQIELTSDLTMVTGDNEIHFNYHEQDVHFNVTAYPQTASRLARRSYASDYANAMYRYCSDNVFCTIMKGNTTYGVYYLTHVVISDPSCIHGGMSNDSWGGSREKATSASNRLGWVVGINGSYFDLSGGTPELASVYIKNGSVVKGSTTNGYEICLKSDGTLFSPGSGVSASSLISQGVVQSWGTYLPTLIAGGVGQSDGNTGYLWPQNVDNTGMSQRFDVIYPRTAIGMVKPCEYYIVTSGERSSKNGTTLWECRDILLGKGCTYARALDGGGSATLVFRGSMINTPPSGRERAVADYLYFAG